ncbi:hypothetical protein JI58_02285 [Marinosulfonomonas sp. PRT-SC04]|nr:hypothetical protein JI58_02285 [Marinosulfonomonas sp. PRT-SC04]
MENNLNLPANVKRITHIGAIYGRVIAVNRKKLGIDQAELGKLVSMKQPAISRLERGETRLTIYDAENIAYALGMSWSELIQKIEKAKRAMWRAHVRILLDHVVQANPIAALDAAAMDQIIA